MKGEIWFDYNGIANIITSLWLIGLPVAILKYLQVPWLLPLGYAANALIVCGPQ